MAEAKAIVNTVNATIADMLVRPNDYVALSSQVGHVLGHHAGTAITADLSARTATQLGEMLGEIAGQIAFEIILQLVLALATEGIGNAARGGLALGQATRGGSRVAQLASRLRLAIRQLPGVERFLAVFARERRAQGLLRVDAEISRAVEAAFAEGARFETGVLRVVRVRETGVTLTAEQLARWRSLRGSGGLPEEFARVWNACNNAQAADGLAEVRRLWALGDDASRLEARRLARVTYNNWRNRFMTRLRDPANAGLRSQIEGAGFRFGESATSSPRLAAGTQERLTLDHSRRLMEDPTRCVDPSNLEFVIGYENSVTLEQLRNSTSVDLF